MRPGTGQDAFNVEGFACRVAVAAVTAESALQRAQLVIGKDVGDATRRNKCSEGSWVPQCVRVQFDSC